MMFPHIRNQTKKLLLAGQPPIYFVGKFGSFLISRICSMWR